MTIRNGFSITLRFLGVLAISALTACSGSSDSAGENSGTLADEEVVSIVMAALVLTLADGDTPSKVTRNFTVPLTGAAGSAISWHSDGEAITLDDSGNATVTRPVYTEGSDIPVALTATVTKGSASDSTSFDLTVIRFGHSDAEQAAALASDKEKLTLELGGGNTPDAIRNDFHVPVIGSSGTTITWLSSDPAIDIDDAGNAVVTRPVSGGNVQVTLTATLSNGETSIDKVFVVTVIDGSPLTRVAEDIAWVNANRAKFFGTPGATTWFLVRADFTVPVAGPSGSTIAWNYNVSNGRITNIDAQGNVTLLHHPGLGTIADNGFLSFTASYNGYFSAEQFSNMTFRYKLTDPQEAILWDKITMAYSMETAPVFPGVVGETHYPYSLVYPPATAGATRMATYTTNKFFALKTDLAPPSGTMLTWKSSNEKIIAINNLTGAVAVMPQATQQVVNITAVFSKDGYSAESPYYVEIVVPAAPPGPVISYKDLHYKVAPNTPFDIWASNNGVMQSCTITPSLPTGLVISTDANYVCRIQGTPTAFQAETLYIVTATDSYGQTGTAELYIEVGAAGITGVLESLGVKPSAVAALADRDGNPLPGDYNPLRRKNVSFFETKEIFAAGENTMMHGLYDNIGVAPGGHNPVALHEYSQADQWGWFTNSVKSGAAGDFDGDGYQEVAVVYLKDSGGATGEVVLQTIDDKSGGYTKNQFVVGAAAYFKTDGSPVPGQADVTAADIDGDGKDELIIALGVRSYADMPDYRTTGPNVWYKSGTGTARFIVLDDAGAGFAKLTEMSVGTDYARSIYVAAADATGSGKADHIAVSAMVGGEAWYYIYRYDAATKALFIQNTGAVQTKVGDTTYRAMLADVTFADFNQNGVPEFVFAGVEEPSEANPDTKYIAMAVEYDGRDFGVLPGAKRWIDYTSGDWKPGAYAYSEACMESRTCDYIKVLDVFVEVLDVDGDAQPDLLINNKVYNAGFNVKTDKLGNEMSIWGMMNNQNVAMNAYNEGSNPYYGYNPFTAFNRSNTWIAVGDFNGDHREDIVYWGRNRHAGMQLWGVDDNGFFTHNSWYNTGDQTNDNQNHGYPVLVAANVDDDSLVVSFNHSETIFTEPMPIAAVAAAPCWADESIQNIEECTSSFGNANTQSTSTAHTLSAHAGVSLGFQTPLSGLGLFSTSVKGTVEFNSEFTFGTEHSLTKSVMFNAGGNEDIVVFMSIPYDVYHYDIVSAPPDNAAAIGSDFTVRVPRKPRIQQAERGYYNRSVSGINPDRAIGSETFSHVPGNPASYPDAAGKSTILNANGGGIQTGPVAVPQGSGSTVLALDVNDTTSSSTVLGFDVTVEVETTVMDTLSLGFSVGGGYARDVSIATTDGTTYEGSVGGITGSSVYADKSYSYGIFAYTKQGHPSGFKFHTVSFWVE